MFSFSIRAKLFDGQCYISSRHSESSEQRRREPRYCLVRDLSCVLSSCHSIDNNNSHNTNIHQSRWIFGTANGFSSFQEDDEEEAEEEQSIFHCVSVWCAHFFGFELLFVWLFICLFIIMRFDGVRLCGELLPKFVTFCTILLLLFCVKVKVAKGARHPNRHQQFFLISSQNFHGQNARIPIKRSDFFRHTISHSFFVSHIRRLRPHKKCVKR